MEKSVFCKHQTFVNVASANGSQNKIAKTYMYVLNESSAYANLPREYAHQEVMHLSVSSCQDKV